MDVHINVKNFGPIEAAEIDLRPLTVFVGESNTGKTYLAALIYALHREFGGFSQFPWSDASADFALVERNTEFIVPEDIEKKFQQEVLEAITKLNTLGRSFKFSDLPSEIRFPSEQIITDQLEFELGLKRCFDIDSVSKLIRFTGNKDNEMEVSLQVSDRYQTCWSFEVRDTGTGPTINGKINPDMILLEAAYRTELHTISHVKQLFETLPTESWRTGKSYYLPAARSGIMEYLELLSIALIKRGTRIGLNRFEVSTLSGMIGDFLEKIIQYKVRNGSPEEIIHIAEQLETDLLGGKIEVQRPTPETYPEFLYRPEQAEEGLRMSHSSAMVSELAPLVLYLRGIVRQGDLLIIEEPESHLHPGAQTIIAKTLARLVRAGVQVLITTHSNYLLQQISNLIREGELQKQGERTSETADYLKAEEVGAWWFHKDKPVEELPYDLVEGIEPEDHLDIAEDLYNQSAGLQNRIEQKKGEETIESE